MALGETAESGDLDLLVVCPEVEAAEAGVQGNLNRLNGVHGVPEDACVPSC